MDGFIRDDKSLQENTDCCEAFRDRVLLCKGAYMYSYTQIDKLLCCIIFLQISEVSQVVDVSELEVGFYDAHRMEMGVVYCN